jgi:hypothetical protein
MRKLAFLLLAFNIVLSPMASAAATVMEFTSEHVHFEHTWHGPDDVPAVHVHEHEDAHDDGDTVSHCHVDHMHSSAFVIATGSDIFVPDFAVTRAVLSASFPVTRYPYPPFRPPQAA